MHVPADVVWCANNASPPPPPPSSPLACTASVPFSNNDPVLVDSANSKIYVFVPTMTNYTDALSSCRSMGSSTGTNGVLVSYSSYAEAFKVESYFAETGPLRPYWLGLRIPDGSAW